MQKGINGITELFSTVGEIQSSHSLLILQSQYMEVFAKSHFLYEAILILWHGRGHFSYKPKSSRTYYIANLQFSQQLKNTQLSDVGL